jgi:hypothetical protein
VTALQEFSLTGVLSRRGIHQIVQGAVEGLPITTSDRILADWSELLSGRAERQWIQWQVFTGYASVKAEATGDEPTQLAVEMVLQRILTMTPILIGERRVPPLSLYDPTLLDRHYSLASLIAEQPPPPPIVTPMSTVDKPSEKAELAS